MKAKFINEKFTEDSDAIHDMGIGEVEYRNLVNAYKELDKYMNFDVEDLDFSKVIETLNYLRRISAYNVARYFNTKYNFYVKIDPKNSMGGIFAEADLEGTDYKLQFDTSGPGKMVGISFFNKKTGRIATNGTRILDPKYAWARTVPREIKGAGRSIHALDNRFRNYCKILNIDITQFKQ